MSILVKDHNTMETDPEMIQGGVEEETICQATCKGQAQALVQICLQQA